MDVKMKVGESQTSLFPASVDDFKARDLYYCNTEKYVTPEKHARQPKGKRQLLFECGCLETTTAKLTNTEASHLLATSDMFIRDVCRRGHRAIMSPIAHPE